MGPVSSFQDAFARSLGTDLSWNYSRKSSVWQLAFCLSSTFIRLAWILLSYWLQVRQCQRTFWGSTSRHRITNAALICWVWDPYIFLRDCFCLLTRPCHRKIGSNGYTEALLIPCSRIVCCFGDTHSLCSSHTTWLQITLILCVMKLEKVFNKTC